MDKEAKDGYFSSIWQIDLEPRSARSVKTLNKADERKKGGLYVPPHHLVALDPTG